MLKFNEIYNECKIVEMMKFLKNFRRGYNKEHVIEVLGIDWFDKYEIVVDSRKARFVALEHIYRNNRKYGFKGVNLGYCYFWFRWGIELYNWYKRSQFKFDLWQGRLRNRIVCGKGFMYYMNTDSEGRLRYTIGHDPYKKTYDIKHFWKEEVKKGMEEAILNPDNYEVQPGIRNVFINLKLNKDWFPKNNKDEDRNNS